MKDHEKVILERERRAIKKLEERFEYYTGNYQCTEYDWGEPMGNEVIEEIPNGA